MVATPRWQPPFLQPLRTIAAAMAAITSICETLILREGEGCHVSASDRQSTGQTLVNWSNSGQTQVKTTKMVK